MPFVSEYKCTECGVKTPRDELMVVKMSFRQMGDFGRTVKSRVMAWLCPPCLEKNEVWRDQSKSQVEATGKQRKKVIEGESPAVITVTPIDPIEEESVVPFPV